MKEEEEEEAPPASLRVGGVVVQLLDSQLWRSFHTLGTEMIITKAGRSVDIMEIQCRYNVDTI